MPRKQAAEAVPQPDFETAMAELEALVLRMENGELSLDASLKEFERGVQLTRLCQAALKAAEQRVKSVSADGQTSDFPELGDT